MRGMAIEPISPSSPQEIRRSAIRQTWRDVVFLHWRTPPETVRPLLPAGTSPDLIDGSAWIGVIGLRMTGLRFCGAPYPPFLELNVRLYSVDRDGRRAVVFRAMEAGDPIFAALSRATLGLPYTWSEMGFTRTDAGEIGYRTRRRLPSPSGVGVRLAVRPRESGGPVVSTPLETALTARWALHQRWYARTLRLPAWHPPWRLQRADLLAWEDSGLSAACGLPSLDQPPESVLYATATTARFGMGRRV
jgi:uncharacterized protein